jgi:tight adherence protein B
MSLLITFFILGLVLTSTVLIVATRPSRAERGIELRVADIRNPRRSLGDDGGEVDLDTQQTSSLGHFLGQRLKQYSFSATMERWILEADSPGTAGTFVLKSVEFSIGFLIAGLVLTRSAVMGLLLAVLGLALPGIWLRFRRAKRLKAVTAALPDAADLLARALRAGHSMSQAIEVMAERAPQPLAAEFARVFQQQRLGVSQRDVLLEMSQRIPSRDLHFLITAILVQRDTGGDLVEILDRTTTVLRERIRVQGQVQVNTAQGRLTGWILSLLPVVLLIVLSLFSPGYSDILFTDPMGRRLLFAGASLILIGGLVIRRIVQVNF